MRSTWYKLAKDIWQGSKWVWTAIIIAILVSVASSVFAGKQAELAGTVVFRVIDWLRIQSFYQSLILILFGLFILVSLSSALATFILGRNNETVYAPPPEVQAILDYFKTDMEATKQREEVQQARDKEAFTQYLRSIEETCETISPRGFAQLSRALVYADVPLNETFVRFQAVSDEPIYDAPGEQQRQLEAMRQRSDLSLEDRDAYLQGLRIIWQSQLRRDVDEELAQQPLFLEEILLRLTSTNSVAILLGAPGSGKTTFLRWLAYQMARASLTPGTYSLPQAIGREQVPILIQTKEYAERLERENLTLKQFLILQWSRVHPNLALKLLDDLSQGRCLVLVDGLDQVASVNVRRRVVEAIHEFIADNYSGNLNNYNRYIVTSRIADSEPGTFARYTHYTLLDLDEQGVEQMLENWCLAIARYRAIANKGMQPLIGQEEAQARIAGTQQQEQLSHMLKHYPDLMRLATNPMALTHMMLLQASGRNLFQYRIELYQMVTRTLLDTWNRESGRSMFSDEEIPVAEQLLSNFAFRLHESGTLLTKYDVVITTRHTLATFHRLQTDEIRESDITRFIDKLRSSSGLFVEGGEDLYYFANRTIQDYHVVLYLLHMPQEELKQFAFQHYRSALWRESLLLALTYKSRQTLLTARSRQLDGPAPREGLATQPLTQSTPQERVRNLQALQGVHQLTKLQVEELLVACIDTRPLPEATQQELSVSTVQQMAWKLLRQPFALDHEAGDAALRALESSKIPISEGAATLLQHSADLPQEIQKQAIEKIWQMLIENSIPYRYSPLGKTEQLRLYDTMFETVQVLSDHS